LAIIESLKHWRHYLEGLNNKFIVLTDHQALKGILNAPSRNLRGRLARWVFDLSKFDFDIQHRPGATNPANGLSRRPDYMAGEMTYEDVLPILTQKLHLASDLSPKMYKLLRTNIAGSESLKRTCVRNYTDKLTFKEGPSNIDRIGSFKGPGIPLPHCSCHIYKAQIAAVRVFAVTTRAQNKSHQSIQSSDAFQDGADVLVAEGLDEAGVTVGQQYIPRQAAIELVPDETALRDDPKRIAFDELIRDLQSRDPSCQAAAEMVRASRTRSSYRLKDGLLLFKNRLIMPPQGTLHRVLLIKHHNDPRAGHKGIGRTLELLKRHFHWEGIANDIARYIAECSTC